MQKKRTSPVFWLALIGLGGAAYVLTTPEAPGKKTPTTQSSRKKSESQSLFTEADYKAKFDPLNTPTKNAFMPLVVRSGGGSGNAGIPNAVPTDFTGGEGGWTYTGTASVDGRIQAVVENQGTGQGDFLSVGQAWKKSKVVAVTDSSLVLEGDSGQQVTIKMQEKLNTGSPLMAEGFAPVNVPPGSLNGPSGPISVQPDQNNQNAQGGRGRGRGRNRGGNENPVQTEGEPNAN